MVRVRSRRKGSYFFVIDAFVAGIILVAATVVLASSFLGRAEEGQTFYTAEDLLSTLETTSIREYDVSMIRNWTANGTINDSSISVLQQFGVFVVTGGSPSSNAEARALASIMGRGAPPSVNYAISANGQVYNESWSTPIADADVVFSSKRIVLLRLPPYDAYDPPIVEVKTWQ